MFEFFRKTMYAAIGGAIMSKKKIDQLGEKMIKEAENSEAEGRKFVDEVSGRTGDDRRTNRIIAEKVEQILRQRDLPSRTEMDTLELRVRNLEKTVAQQQSSEATIGKGI